MSFTQLFSDPQGWWQNRTGPERLAAITALVAGAYGAGGGFGGAGAAGAAGAGAGAAAAGSGAGAAGAAATTYGTAMGAGGAMPLSAAGKAAIMSSYSGMGGAGGGLGPALSQVGGYYGLGGASGSAGGLGASAIMAPRASEILMTGTGAGQRGGIISQYANRLQGYYDQAKPWMEKYQTVNNLMQSQQRQRPQPQVGGPYQEQRFDVSRFKPRMSNVMYGGRRGLR